MKTNGSPPAAVAACDWEYVVEDLLEMKSSLTARERRRLLRELRGKKPAGGPIDLHPAFSLERRAVLVLKDSGVSECWIFRPKEKTIRKIPIR